LEITEKHRRSEDLYKPGGNERLISISISRQKNITVLGVRK